MSGMVVHDLSASLNVINLISTRLKKNPNFINDPKYVNNLVDSVNNCLRLVDSLRAFIEDKGDQTEVSTVGVAFEYVQRLIELQFQDGSMPSYKLYLDENIRNVKLRVSQNSLIHIFFNLASNSIENFQQNDLKNSTFLIKRSEKQPADKGRLALLIADNGTGLSEENFEKFTNGANLGADLTTHKTLGLRLVRRMIENMKGELTIAKTSKSGTTFRLELELYDG